MSTSRYLAIVLAACSGSTAPRPWPITPPETATASATAPAAEPRVPVADPACVQEPAPDGAGEAGEAGDASEASDPGDAAAISDDEPRRRHPPRPTNACTVNDGNLAREAAAILAAPRAGGKPIPRTAWNHKTPPERLDLIQRRFELARPELDFLNKTGVVVPARLELPSYAYGYHEIFQSQLPVYTTADSLFHAIFASHDAAVAQLERSSIAPALASALDRMHCALPAASVDYPAETAHDLDLYLTVARSLAGTDAVRSIRGDASIDREAADLVAKVHAAAGAETIMMFGRPRLVDFTQYTPRGHYTSSEELTRYFLTAMWASRIEFNLVSRSSRSSAPGPEPDPSETPREAIDALALADLAAASGAAAGIDTVDRAWTLLAGRREDVSIGQLAALRAQGTSQSSRMRRRSRRSSARSATASSAPRGCTPCPRGPPCCRRSRP